MSNRLLAILVLLVIFGSIFGAYWYFFVANVGSVVVTVSGASQVQVNLATEFKYEKSQLCTESCIFEGVPPVNMTISAQKEGFDTESQTLKLDRGEKIVIGFTLKKTVVLEDKPVDKQEKIMSIKIKSALANDSESGSLVFLGMYNENGYVYSTQSGFSLFTYATDGTKTLALELPGLKVKGVIWNESEGILVIKGDVATGFLDLSTGIYTKLTLTSEAQYVKKGPQDGQYIVRASDAAYLMKTSDGSILRDGIYDDYILVAPGKILGLLRKNSTEKMSLLNLASDGKAKLVLQDVATRDRRVVYSTEDDIVGIQSVDGKIIAATADGKGGEVKNLEY